MKTCPRCGVENKPEKSACWNCWAPLEAPSGGALRPLPKRGPSLRIPTVPLVAGLIAIVAAVAIYFLFLSSDPADVATQYLQAARNGNDKKRQQLSTSATASLMFLPDVLRILDEPVADATNRTESGGTAEVPVTLKMMMHPMKVGTDRIALTNSLNTYLSRNPVTAKVVLTKQGISWRVDQAQTTQRILDAVTGGAPLEIKSQFAQAGLRVAGLPPAPATPPVAPVATPVPGPPTP